MRSIRTKLLLALAALAVTAVAAPAGAAAEFHWTKEGAPLGGNDQFSSTGNTLTLSNADGGLSCTFGATTYLTGNSNEGAIVPTGLVPSACKTTAGKSACSIASMSLRNYGFWRIFGSLGGIGTGSGITVKYNKGGFCVYGEDSYSVNYFLDVDDISAMSTWTSTTTVDLITDGVTKPTTQKVKFNLNPPKIYGVAL